MFIFTAKFVLYTSILNKIYIVLAVVANSVCHHILCDVAFLSSLMAMEREAVYPSSSLWQIKQCINSFIHLLFFNIIITSFWHQEKIRRWATPLNTQCLKKFGGTRETLGSLWLPWVRDTEWNSFCLLPHLLCT